MKNLRQLLIMRFKVNKLIAIIFLLLSLIGFLDSTYLTIEHYADRGVRCFIVKGCNDVLKSNYSTFLGLPVAILGALYYLTIFVLTVIYFDLKKDTIFLFASLATIGGFIASLWFLYLQFFILNSFCFYCLISALTSSILFILGTYIMLINKKQIKKEFFEKKTELNTYF